MDDTRTQADDDFEMLYAPHFTLDEFICQCVDLCDPFDTDWFTGAEFRAFMAKLMRMRTELEFPFVVNSGRRCPAYNDLLYVRRGSDMGNHLDGPHTIAAADLKVSFERAYDLVNLATSLDMGVGIDQKGDVADRYVHVDNLGRRIWTY